MIDEEVEKVWNEFWKPIVEKDGEVDMDQIKKELYDFHMVMQEVSKVYDHITNGKISKLLTHADVVISEADDCYFWLYNDPDDQ